MARDFTDYIVEVHGGGERVYFQEHYRQLRKDVDVSDFELNGRSYLLNKDRAYRVKGYQPWKKWHSRHPLRSIKEITRTKKVGLIKYREPAPKEASMVEVVYEVPIGYSCTIDKCAFETKSQRAMKSHVTKKHKGANPDMITEIETKTVTELQPMIDVVEPLHTSRMHQPSGILRVGDKPVELEDDSLLNIITPRLLKIEIEDDLYRKAYKSYKFGEVLPITKKWWVWVIVAVVAVFVIQIVTGNFKV